jgi:hypothetical protein
LSPIAKQGKWVSDGWQKNYIIFLSKSRQALDWK